MGRWKRIHNLNREKSTSFLLLTALLTTGCGISGNDNSYALENEVPANTSEDTTQPNIRFEIPKRTRNAQTTMVRS